MPFYVYIEELPVILFPSRVNDVQGMLGPVLDVQISLRAAQVGPEPLRETCQPLGIFPQDGT